MRGAHGERGFTLLELLVATALGAVLLAALYAVFFSVLKGHGMVEKDLERTREMRRFLDVFRMEVESSFFS
ncbi:MAG: prepilin-type N-terminal cleavage/methylation domain-containing protein [Deltaproteobacteria bacterium]|nr:prepilin-type N-terminal cleavage/methylation domain-containing protein [Deltaproteobacteria bacterium]